MKTRGFLFASLMPYAFYYIIIGLLVSTIFSVEAMMEHGTEVIGAGFWNMWLRRIFTYPYDLFKFFGGGGG